MGKEILKLNSFSERIDTINENIKELYKRLDSLDKRTNERVTNDVEILSNKISATSETLSKLIQFVDFDKELVESTKSNYLIFKESLLLDDILVGWHSNISCWFMDVLHLQNKTSNELAHRFINKFFEIDYDWMQLVKTGSCKITTVKENDKNEVTQGE